MLFSAGKARPSTKPKPKSVEYQAKRKSIELSSMEIVLMPFKAIPTARS